MLFCEKLKLSAKLCDALGDKFILIMSLILVKCLNILSKLSGEDCSGGSQLLLQICLYFIILNISNIVSRFRILKWLLPNIIIAAGFTLLWGLMQGFSFPIAFTAVSVSLFPNSLISVKNASSCPSKVELIIPVLFTPQYSSLSNIERWFKFHWE